MSPCNSQQENDYQLMFWHGNGGFKGCNFAYRHYFSIVMNGDTMIGLGQGDCRESVSEVATVDREHDLSSKSINSITWLIRNTSRSPSNHVLFCSSSILLAELLVNVIL